MNIKDYNVFISNLKNQGYNIDSMSIWELSKAIRLYKRFKEVMA